MRFEIRLTIGGNVGRIKVLAANPRTARGFSGDLILDEFAFHEDSAAIWEAAEPIISSNPDFLCRILSTGNGRRNMFYQLISEGRIAYRRIRRSDAWATGELKIYSQVDGRELTPAEARSQSSDKRAYDQNYECAFEDENTPLLTAELISAAERADLTDGVDRQTWRAGTLARMAALPGWLDAGLDVGRSRDLSVLTVVACLSGFSARRVVGMLEMENLRLPDQQKQLDALCALDNFRGVEIDMTGLGLGLFEYAETRHGSRRVRGVHFSSTEPVGRAANRRWPQSHDGPRHRDHGDRPGGNVRGPPPGNPRRSASARRPAPAGKSDGARGPGFHRREPLRRRPRRPFLEPRFGGPRRTPSRANDASARLRFTRRVASLLPHCPRFTGRPGNVLLPCDHPSLIPVILSGVQRRRRTSQTTMDFPDDQNF